MHRTKDDSFKKKNEPPTMAASQAPVRIAFNAQSSARRLDEHAMVQKQYVDFSQVSFSSSNLYRACMKAL